MHLRDTVSILARWFRCFLHNLISPIALPSQIQSIMHCFCKGFAGCHGYSGSKEPCVRRRIRVDNLTAVYCGVIHKTTSFHSQESVSCFHLLYDWLCATPLQLTSSKSLDFPAVGKVTHFCCGWFVGLSELLFIWPLTLNQFALQEAAAPSDTVAWVTGTDKPLLHNGLGQPNISTLSWWSIAAKNDTEIADTVE